MSKNFEIDWFFLMLGLVLIVSMYLSYKSDANDSKVKIEKEKTRQIELQIELQSKPYQISTNLYK